MENRTRKEGLEKISNHAAHEWGALRENQQTESRHGHRLHWLDRGDAEDGEGWGNLFEFGEGSIFVDGDVRAGAGCSLEVRLQDGGALIGGELIELDFFAKAAAENCSSAGCAHILDPARIVSEHGHEVALSIDDGHDHREGESPPRLSSSHFQSLEVVGRNARRAYSSPRSIQNPRDPVGSLPTVQPSFEVAWSHLFADTEWVKFA